LSIHIIGNLATTSGAVDAVPRLVEIESFDPGGAIATAKKRFEPGTYTGEGNFVFVRNPESAALFFSYSQLLVAFGPNVAAFEVVQRVYAHNPISWWTVHRSPDFSRARAEAIGLCTYLPLNARGVAAIRAGVLNGLDPDFGLLSCCDEDLAGLYLWAWVAQGLFDLCCKLTGHAIGVDLCARIPVFGKITTEASLNAIRRSSKRVTPACDLKMGSLFELRFPRHFLQEQDAMQIYEGSKMKHSNGSNASSHFTPPYCAGNVRPVEDRIEADAGRQGVGEAQRSKPEQAPSRRSRPKLVARIASTADDIAKVFALRAAVFMAEQECPYEEEFDGNDYCGTHVLGLVDGVPAATLRIRYFADFVKIERLAVLPRFRRTAIAREVVEYGLELVRRKGYTKMYGQAQIRLVNFWRKFGFEPMAKNSALVFSDHEYVEIAGSLAPHADRLTMHSDPYMLIRAEGRWDVPGVLDSSASREATNPC
jgi:predicted GNAT family N-acyltransferase